MKKINGIIELSASDLVNHQNCNHLTELDLQVVSGTKTKPDQFNPLLDLLRERGIRHEEAYINHLKHCGYNAFTVEGVDVSDGAVEKTMSAMRQGWDVIIQGALKHGAWKGRADILMRVEHPSQLGDWSYEVIDTKLARETKGGTVLQLSLYADLLSAMQGAISEYVHVVTPWNDYQLDSYRFADYAAFFRNVKLKAEVSVNEGCGSVYPEPKAHCDVCRWQQTCDDKRRSDDHLSLVANITKNQINELNANGIETMQQLADLSVPFPFLPNKGSIHSFEKVKAQSELQVKSRQEGCIKYELLDVVSDFGFSALPEPSIGDVFFDIESNQFVGEHGIEYLLGYVYLDENNQTQYQAEWGMDREQEKFAFENFIVFIKERRQKFPDMHIYHYAPYEPSALKRLMGRYATCEDEVDDLLRGQVFVDLLSIVRNALRASVESYSLKRLEPFYLFNRTISLHDANTALTKLSSAIELDDSPSISRGTKYVVEQYNADDCRSTFALRNWLEELRRKLIDDEGIEIERPLLPELQVNEELDGKAIRIKALMEKLLADVPVDIEGRSKEQQSKWVLAHLLEWHRREVKSTWWEYFRLCDLTSEDLLGERIALANLAFVETVEKSKTGIPTDRYSFEKQDTDLRGSEDLRAEGGDKIGKAISVSIEERTIDIKKSKATAGIHPKAVFSHQVFNSSEQEESLYRLGEYVAENGFEGAGAYKSARDLLLRKPPLLSNSFKLEDGEDTLLAAIRICGEFEGGVIPIQGPPGTGKSYTGARMICEFVRQGKSVGITANSHKVIGNLLEKVIEASIELGLPIKCMQKASSSGEETEYLSFAKKNGDIFSALEVGSVQVVGATSFVWSRAEAIDSLDVLFVDEAAQMSLANVLSVSQSASGLILLGDPQQLEQPSQGSHPDGTDVSALEYIIEDEKAITPDEGLFLETTWRLQQKISVFNSELFYESKLLSLPDCKKQEIISDGLIKGSGLRYVSVDHSGNQSSSIEEAEVVRDLVDNILTSDSYWIDRAGEKRAIGFEDIVIIAPYNAHVFEIQSLLPTARVGTVDKFQGQEAPIAIYSMATSSYADAPRGMDFLYSSNRLNVATSRAKCIVIMVSSPMLFEPDCRTPDHMRLANGYCRYLELANEIEM